MPHWQVDVIADKPGLYSVVRIDGGDPRGVRWEFAVSDALTEGDEWDGLRALLPEWLETAIPDEWYLDTHIIGVTYPNRETTYIYWERSSE